VPLALRQVPLALRRAAVLLRARPSAQPSPRPSNARAFERSTSFRATRLTT
jgi:hypothetical protein